MKNSKGKRSLVELISYDHIVEGGYVCDFFKKAAGPDPRVGNQVVDCGSIHHNQYELQMTRKKHNIWVSR